MRISAVTVCVSLLAAAPARAIDDYERPPIAYSDSEPDNAVARLQARLDAGDVTLPHDDRFGYLPGVLARLDVPVSSQTLVFSKTSLQQRWITPRNPRAVYFNDDVYVGFVRGGDVMEVSVADPALGTVFYTLDQEAAERPRFVRRTDDCLLCHGGSQTGGVPGHVVRSVYADASGQPILAAGSHRVDPTTPFVQRFGGWYVTGTHGAEKHLGNVTFRKRPDHDGVDDTSGLNLTDLGDRIETRDYLSPHSDLVALMVLIHQAAAHNTITRAGFDVRLALHREAALNRETGAAPGHRWPSTDTVLDAAAESLVERFLGCDEPPLAAPIGGTSSFATDFAARGPATADGRSLRALDLRTRLFRHPCSFLITSESFAALPEELRGRFWRRMADVVAGRGPPDRFAHLSVADRTAIREILAEVAGEAKAFSGP